MQTPHWNNHNSNIVSVVCIELSEKERKHRKARYVTTIGHGEIIQSIKDWWTDAHFGPWLFNVYPLQRLFGIKWLKIRHLGAYYCVLFPWLILENLISQGPKSWKPFGGQIRKIYCGFPPISVKASEYFPKGQPYVSIWPSPLTARHYLGGGSLFKMPRLGPTTSNSPDLRTVFAMPKQGYGLQRKAVQFRGWVRTVWLSYPK